MIKFTYIILFFVVAPIIACHRSPFVNHKLKFEKVSDNCQNLKPYFQVESNLAGERYEFEECLDTGFSKEMMKVTRQGDTVVVQFPKQIAQAALYKITLDIDSYPRYNFVTVDDNTFIVTTSKD